MAATMVPHSQCRRTRQSQPSMLADCRMRRRQESAGHHGGRVSTVAVMAGECIVLALGSFYLAKTHITEQNN